MSVHFSVAADRHKDKIRFLLSGSSLEEPFTPSVAIQHALSTLEHMVSHSCVVDRGHRFSSGKSEFSFWISAFHGVYGANDVSSSRGTLPLNANSTIFVPTLPTSRGATMDGNQRVENELGYGSTSDITMVHEASTVENDSLHVGQPAACRSDVVQSTAQVIATNLKEGIGTVMGVLHTRKTQLDGVASRHDLNEPAVNQFLQTVSDRCFGNIYFFSYFRTGHSAVFLKQTDNLEIDAV